MKDRRVRWPHVAAGLFVAGMVALAWAGPAAYHRLVQEDGPLEWATAALFAVAGVLRLRQAIRARRPFDGLVALFCLFVAGEEFSWGQRLVGYTPPEYFLEGNAQQEANLHNFADWFGRPGLTLALLLAAYGLLFPLGGRWRIGRSWLDRFGASTPAVAFAPWFGLAALLLWAYPLEYTGEWVEALAGGLFLASRPGAPRRPSLRPWVVAGAAAAVMTALSWSALRSGERRLACAGAEAEALLRDLVSGSAALEPLASARFVHKRVYSAQSEGYVDATRVTGYRRASPCAGEGVDEAAERRRFALDPWGMSYWIVSDARGRYRRIVVYSMGPNRRRDGAAGEAAGDDVVVYAELEIPAAP